MKIHIYLFQISFSELSVLNSFCDAANKKINNFLNIFQQGYILYSLL